MVKTWKIYLGFFLGSDKLQKIPTKRVVPISFW